MSGRTNTASASLLSGSLVTAANIPFDASRSNTTYGSSETVTPLSLSTKFFIKY